MEIDKRPAWLSRAMNKNTPTKNGATVRTSSEYDADLIWQRRQRKHNRD